MLVGWTFIQSFLDIPETKYSQVETLIGWITRKAEVITRRELEQAERTVYLSGYGDKTLVLPHWPVVSIASITADDTEVTEYTLDGSKGLVYRTDSTFPKGDRNIKVVYTAGWTDSTTPDDVKLACIEAISWNLKRINDEAMGIKNQTTPDGVNVGYELVLPLSVQRVFESYRSVGV
jgi:hypothetical protein